MKTKSSATEQAGENRLLRYEIKMVCQEHAYEHLLMILRLHPSCLRTVFPPRHVQSVYLDTHRGRAMEDNLAGISHREKIRFRWYGLQNTGVRGKLELKVREGTVGWKEIVPVEAAVDVEGARRNAFMKRLTENAPLEWRIRLSEGLDPVQWIAYLREYFVTANGRVRLTVDRKLKAWDQRGRFMLSSLFATPLPRVVIVEAKCDSEDYDEMRELMNRLPLYVDKCSKFVLASSPNHGPIVSIFPL